MPKMSGGVEGFNIDLAEEIGRRLKRPITVDAAQFSVLPPAMQAQGVATAALGHLRDALLQAGAFDALWTRHRVGHAAAVVLMQRLGFVPKSPVDGWQRWRLDRRSWRALVDAPPAD